MEWFKDEDEGDETWETLLCESCEVPHQGAGVRGNQDDAEDHGPDTDPETKR